MTPLSKTARQTVTFPILSIFLKSHHVFSLQFYQYISSLFLSHKTRNHQENDLVKKRRFRLNISWQNIAKEKRAP